MVGIPFSRWLTAVELRIIRNLRYTDIYLHYLPPCNAEDANALSPEYSPSVSVDAVVKAGRFASVGNAANIEPHCNTFFGAVEQSIEQLAKNDR